MDKAILQKLFLVDEKTNRIGTEGEPSAGLGLILCKDFVLKNRGEIWAESQVNIGSTFHFTLPIS
jgi:signal transduction histidine kinase